MTKTAALSDIAPSGVLRVAINTGNRALVQRDGSELSGVSPALARRLAQEINARLEPVIYDGAGKVFGDAGCDVWDVGFLAIDAVRARKVAFTKPYITIEATYAVRASSPVADVGGVDRTGTTVLTAKGSAYDMFLTDALQHASLERFGTPPESFAAFRDGRCDVVGGVRASLDAFFADDPDVRILPGVLTAVHQAMVLPQPNHPCLPALNDFVDRAIRDGFVAKQS